MKFNTAPRMMTIRQTAKLGILPENALRVMEREGTLPAMKAGNKTIINVDRLIEQLNQLGQQES